MKQWQRVNIAAAKLASLVMGLVTFVLQRRSATNLEKGHVTLNLPENHTPNRTDPLCVTAVAR